jgi:hypothetical protein
MSEILKAVIFDVATGETNERPLTAHEIAEYQTVQQQQQALEAEAQAKADARLSALAKLADLGLTQDEINAL